MFLKRLTIFDKIPLAPLRNRSARCHVGNVIMVSIQKTLPKSSSPGRQSGDYGIFDCNIRPTVYLVGE